MGSGARLACARLYRLQLWQLRRHTRRADRWGTQRPRLALRLVLRPPSGGGRAPIRPRRAPGLLYGGGAHGGALRGGRGGAGAGPLTLGCRPLHRHRRPWFLIAGHPAHLQPLLVRQPLRLLVCGEERTAALGRVTPARLFPSRFNPARDAGDSATRLRSHEITGMAASASAEIAGIGGLVVGSVPVNTAPPRGRVAGGA